MPSSKRDYVEGYFCCVPEENTFWQRCVLTAGRSGKFGYQLKGKSKKRSPEAWKFVADCSKIRLQRNVLKVLPVSSLSEAGKSVLPLKRKLADRLGKKTEVLESADKAPKRGAATKQTWGFDAQIFCLGLLFVLSSSGSLCVLVAGSR